MVGLKGDLRMSIPSDIAVFPAQTVLPLMYAKPQFYYQTVDDIFIGSQCRTKDIVRPCPDDGEVRSHSPRHKMGVEEQREARDRSALLKKRAAERVKRGVWQEPKDQAARDIAGLYVARAKSGGQQKEGNNFQRNILCSVGGNQPQVFPHVDEPADMLAQVAGRIAKVSLRSNQVAVSNQELVTQMYTDPNTFELEDGSAVMVSTIPQPLGNKET